MKKIKKIFNEGFKSLIINILFLFLISSGFIVISTLLYVNTKLIIFKIITTIFVYGFMIGLIIIMSRFMWNQGKLMYRDLKIDNSHEKTKPEEKH